MLTDSHSHLNFNAFNGDREKIIKRSLASGVFMINVGTNFENSKLAVEIAERYDKGVYAAIGLHPINIKKKSKVKNQESEDNLEKDFDYEKYRNLVLSSKKVVAIGEAGLDYLYLPEEKYEAGALKQKQKEILLKQLKLAEELDLPIIFHCRKAHDELIGELREMNCESKRKGVIHCFTGNWQQAKKYLAMGFYLGFNGIIFKLNLEEAIRKIPLDRILIETDCPFLTPPMAGPKRNEPLFVKHIIRRIAEIKNESLEKIGEASFENAQKLFSRIKNPPMNKYM